jgi:hypothetical protein
MPKRALVLVVMMAAASAAGPAFAPSFADEKSDACSANPTHACVLDLLWDQMARVQRDYQAETKRAFIDAALLTGDKALVDLYMQRTEWRNADALNASYIGLARQKKDRAALVSHGDKAISGVSYDWYQLSAIAQGLAEVGEVERAYMVADIIPHGDEDGVTTLNLHTHAREVISFHDVEPLTLRQWANGIATGEGWWTGEDLAWLNDAAERTADINAFSAELQARYRADGWKYLRALVRLAPRMNAPDAARIFRAHVETWADPRNKDAAELVLAIATRASPEVRTAVLEAFDGRQPSPPPRIARLRNLMGNLDAPMTAADKAALGRSGGTFEQKQAAQALATLTQEEFIAMARAGEGPFSLSRPAVMRAALTQSPGHVYALAIATLMTELGEPRTIDGYDYAQYATEWAVDTCEAELFAVAESRLARRDGLDTRMWAARFDRDPVAPVRFLKLDDRISSEVSDALAGYQKIIAKGYCPGG